MYKRYDFIYNNLVVSIMTDEKRSGKILEAKTIKASLFKSLFESLKLVLTEANLTWDESGLKVIAVESNKIALVHLTVNAESFETYYVQDRLVLGVDMQTFFKCIKSVSSKDILTFYVDEQNPSKLCLTMESAEKGMYGRYEVPLKKLREFTVNDQLTFNKSPPEVTSSVFQKICRDMHTHGTNIVEIKTFKDQLVFTSKDGDALHEVSLNVGNGDTDQKNADNDSDIVQNTFLLKFLVMFSKASHLAPRVKILLQNDMPLVLEYVINGIGSLRYLLTNTTPEHLPQK
jgi:proliferating cell nuclear antigen